MRSDRINVLKDELDDIEADLLDANGEAEELRSSLRGVNERIADLMDKRTTIQIEMDKLHD